MLAVKTIGSNLTIQQHLRKYMLPSILQAKTHGIAFQLLGEAALDYLQKRECTLGGYVTHITTFHPRPVQTKKPDSDSSDDETSSSSSSSSWDNMTTLKPFHVLLYVATPASIHWMGPSPLKDIAEQVILY